jgi:hypothetical protein
VEIVVYEEPTAAVEKTADWDSAIQAARELTNYDFEAVREQRDYGRKHAADHLSLSSWTAASWLTSYEPSRHVLVRAVPRGRRLSVIVQMPVSLALGMLALGP